MMNIFEIGANDAPGFQSTITHANCRVEEFGERSFISTNQNMKIDKLNMKPIGGKF